MQIISLNWDCISKAHVRARDLMTGDQNLKTYLTYYARTEVSVWDSVAIRGGSGSTVGMISIGAIRCDRVTVPLGLAHIMTIGESAILWPKPLCCVSEVL